MGSSIGRYFYYMALCAFVSLAAASVARDATPLSVAALTFTSLIALRFLLLEAVQPPNISVRINSEEIPGDGPRLIHPDC